MIVAVGLLVSTHLAAQPLNDLQTRMVTMRNDQPTRIEVEIELRHRGSAPLHLNKEKKRGKAVVVYGPKRGVESIERWWLGTSTRFSAWKKSNVESETSLLGDAEAFDLVNPAEMIELFLSEATLLSDEKVTWQGKPARYLVIRPGLLGPESERFAIEAKIWLDESGVPLAMERAFELRLGPALKVTEHQALTFQQVGGRLLVDEARETYSGTALAVLRGKDSRKMKVVSVR